MIYERFYLDKTLFFNWIKSRARIFRGIILAFRFVLAHICDCLRRCVRCALSIFRGFLFTFVCCVQFWFSMESSVIAHKRSLILIISWHLVIDTFRSPFIINFLLLYGLQCCVPLACIRADKTSTAIKFITLWISCGSDTSRPADFFFLFKVRPARSDIVTELTKPDENKNPNKTLI